jgi:nucleoside 2-deoxyribosyltransferase
MKARSGESGAVGPYTIYSAGGLFTQHDLGTNVLIKEAVWRLSNGKFQLVLPQFRELVELDRPDVEAYIRNTDLLEVVKADILMARFDGLELDSGTVVEFCLAKSLGKPAVILRSDFRGLSGTEWTDPYNLMVKNWPRTVDVHLHSFMLWADLLTQEHQALGDSDSVETTIQTELGIVQKSLDELAKRIIAGLEAVLEMESPYPPAYQEVLYRALRLSPGSGFDQLLTASELEAMIQRFRAHGTL